MESIINSLSKYKENNRIEAKTVKDKLPSSLWETYSSFANTFGGVILLGVIENPDHSLKAIGVLNAEKLQTDFWNLVNDKHKVSANILKEENVRIETTEDGKDILIIEVPRAPVPLRPIYINNDIWDGSFKRNHSGDYHCDRQEVRNMVAESQPDVLDLAPLPSKVTFECLSLSSIESYRRRFASLFPTHQWNSLSHQDFLLRLGGAIIEKGEWHVTKAGLLFFGYDWQILPYFPEYFLDYQYWSGSNKTDRWDNRIVTGLGQGDGNVYDFFLRVSEDISSRLPTPFQINGETMMRIEDTPAKKAVREVLVNALSNANYQFPQGVTVVFNGHYLTASNPGNMLVEPEKALEGGRSDARNKTIFRLFNAIGFGDRSGWGVSYLEEFAKTNSGTSIQIIESTDPDRTTVTVPFLSNKVIQTVSYEKYIESIEKGASFTREAISSTVALSDSTLTRKLYKSIKTGELAKGDKRGVFIKL